MSKKGTTSIEAVIDEFLAIYEDKNAHKTARTYRAALAKFGQVLELNHIPLASPVARMNFDLVEDFIALLHEKDAATDENKLSVATEKAYLTAFRRFAAFVSARGYADVNVVRVQENIRLLQRSEGRRIPDVDIEGVKEFLGFVENYAIDPGDPDQAMRDRRDRALIFFLAHGGFRIEEACSLKRENLNMAARQARFIGKKDKEAIVRVTEKAFAYLKEYLASRQTLDGSTGRELQKLPLFARHDRAAGKKIKPISTVTGWKIVEDWLERAKKAGHLETLYSPITPHTLRHYFVTKVYMATGDLKIAQELARHDSTATTERYTHLISPRLDQAHRLAFEELES
jgi:integrase/recombinase XerC